MSDEKMMDDYERVCAGLQQGGVIDPGSVADNHGALEEIIYTPVVSVVSARGFWDRLSEAIDAVHAEHQQPEQMRAMIREEIHNALYPGGTIDAHDHRRVEMVEESGKRWRGVLYLVSEE